MCSIISTSGSDAAVGESRYAHPFLAEARSRKRLFNHCQTQSKSQSNLSIEILRSESACSDQSRLNAETQINLTKRLTSKRSLQRFSSAKTSSSESSFSHSNPQFACVAKALITPPFSQRREKKCPLKKRLIRRLAATDCYGLVAYAQRALPLSSQRAFAVLVRPLQWSGYLRQSPSRVVLVWIEFHQQLDPTFHISSRSKGVQINGGSIPRSRQASSILGRFSGFAMCLQFHVNKNCIP